MSGILLILFGIVGVLFILWLVFKDAVEIDNFGEFVCGAAMFVGIGAVIGFIIGIFVKNQLKGIIIGAIIGIILFIGFCLLCAYCVHADKKSLQQYHQSIDNIRKQNKQILSQQWKCPVCGVVHSPNENICLTALVRYYNNGELIERQLDIVKAYDMFFHGDCKYLKTCTGWRCDICGSTNISGFVCKNCEIESRSKSYNELWKDINEIKHAEYLLPDGKKEEIYN